ncbi:MAG TPA: 2Fe-2S iron-sulfur cluster-binding protein [Bacteroidales bacterium]|nr:2Fe-2S iron-sulfur cluster-binding protein [Bacteroidales bacterium]
MFKISSHPILEVKETPKVKFTYEGKVIEGHSGYTIAAALHQAGFPVHSHSLKNRDNLMKRIINCSPQANINLIA